MAKVLLVVNDVQGGYDLHAALVKAGHAVFLEFNGRDGLTIAEQEDIDVIACDAVLPGMFGTDLIVASRATRQRPELPGILLSQLPHALSYELSDAEPVQVLPSPYSAEQLVAWLARLGFAGRAGERRRYPNSKSLGHRRRSTDQRTATPRRASRHRDEN